MRLRVAFLASVPAIAALGLMLPADAGPATQTKLERLPYSGSVLVARAIRAGTIHLANGNVFAQQGELPKKKKKVLNDVDASSGVTRAVDETPIAVNPLNAKQLITGGNDYACGSVRGFWTSNDGGKTWSGACAQDVSGSTSGGGDPVVGYDLNGTVYQGGIDFLNNGDWVIGVASSTNNGKTWNAPVTAVQLGSDLTDKPWLEIDANANSPNKNNLYVSNSMFGAGSSTTIYVTMSKDGGKTWNSVAASPTAEPPHINQFSDLAIGSDGTVYLSYMNCPGGGSVGCDGTTSTMYFQKSADGGKTWSKQVAIGQFTLTPDGGCGNYYGSVPNTCARLSNTTSIGVDNSGGARNGQLYFSAFNWNGTNSVVEVASSTDGGSTWSKPVPVGDSKAKNDQFYGWMSVDPQGNVGVSWMDRRNDPSNISYEEFGAKSTNGGASFGKNFQLASQPSNPNNDGVCGCFIGDYSGSTFAGKTLHSAWTDTRNGSYSQDYVGGLK
jgi:hypothetical protein